MSYTDIFRTSGAAAIGVSSKRQQNMNRKITDLLAEVPEGQSRLFKAKHASADENRFVEVMTNWNYDAVVSWTNPPEPLQSLWTGSRVKPRNGLDTLVEQPDFRFRKKLGKLVDFFQSQGAAYLVSPALLDVIERLDPGSLDVMPVMIKALDGEVPFNLVMPNRALEAVDPDRCDVQIERRKIVEQCFTDVRFPNGAAFQSELTKGIHNFADIDAFQKWFWSRELLAAAKEAGIRGIYATVPAGLSSSIVDEF
ncbi:MAG: DUF1629 domain-containing protein [Chakrabartia sp.]